MVLLVPQFFLLLVGHETFRKIADLLGIGVGVHLQTLRHHQPHIRQCTCNIARLIKGNGQREVLFLVFMSGYGQQQFAQAQHPPNFCLAQVAIGEPPKFLGYLCVSTGLRQETQDCGVLGDVNRLVERNRVE